MKFGLIGEVLGHSQSPLIHQKILSAMGISGTYDLLEIPRAAFAEDFPRRIRELDGFNVTIPYKTAVIPFLAALSGEAARIGAVNTVLREGDRLTGYNTDYIGFSRTVDRIGADPAGRQAAILGTGGAARAVLQCLFDRKAGELLVVSRRPETVGDHFRAFAEALGARIVGYDSFSGKDGYLLVNCTPCGMYPECEGMPLEEPVVARFPKVIDLIYNPRETRLLQTAARHGADTANGMYMLVGQAAAAEEIWLGRAISKDLIEQTARDMETLL